MLLDLCFCVFMCMSFCLCRCCAISGKFLLIDILQSHLWDFLLLEFCSYVLISLIVSLLCYIWKFPVNWHFVISIVILFLIGALFLCAYLFACVVIVLWRAWRVIIIRKSKKNRRHNCQKKKDKRTKNDLQNIHIKLKIE